MSDDRYRASEALFARAVARIPGGVQTRAKGRDVYPWGSSPYFAARASGSAVWDVDGNRYADFVSGLMAILLGHDDPDVRAAVTDQLARGSIFSLSSGLEIEVAERLCELVPCAEMAVFGKSGSDATSAAVRLARACTGRDHVLACGYHGWHDWSIGTTRHGAGVPDAVRALTHRFRFGAIDELHALLGEHDVAAVVLEPIQFVEPPAGFLAEAAELTRRHGAVLVFDETITGFRHARGGAQELLGVVPDLAALGKGMANGLPLSALVGRGDLMRRMEHVFFSFTFGGEALSLAACAATLDKLRTRPVVETIARTGADLAARLQQLIRDRGLAGWFEVIGHPARTLFRPVPRGERPPDPRLGALLAEEMFARGVINTGVHNVTYCHGTDDIDALIAAYDGFLARVGPAIHGGQDIEALLAGRGAPAAPH